MLKKVFKRDMRAIFSTWWIVAVCVLGVALAGAVALRLSLLGLSSEDASVAVSLLSTLGMLGAFFSIFAVVASFTVTAILVYYYFYRNFYSDEGYLTFTLPVSRRTLFLSKTLSAVIWQLLHYALLIVCLFIYLLIAPAGGEEGIFGGDILSGLGEALSMLGELAGAWLLLYIPALLLALVATVFFSTVLAELCITVGAVVTRKYKLLVGIGIYYAVNTAFSFAAQVVMLLGGQDLIGGAVEKLLAMSSGLAALTGGIIILALAVAVATVSLAVYFLVQHIIDNKLDLV